MSTATVSEAKNRLSALIDRVRHGDSVLILDRGVPVARLEAVTGAGDPSGQLRRLERAGTVRPGSGAAPLDLLRSAPPPLPAGASAVGALLDERASGR
jgi:antitoxin (DNA-binding transcriptional repressor) of toxin-antitoxin stability system